MVYLIKVSSSEHGLLGSDRSDGRPPQKRAQKIGRRTFDGRPSNPNSPCSLAKVSTSRSLYHLSSRVRKLNIIQDINFAKEQCSKLDNNFAKEQESRHNNSAKELV
jgi:hypothetical protein